MAIDKLNRIIIRNTINGLQTSRLPNTVEMMNKINEIINHVNSSERCEGDGPKFGTVTYNEWTGESYKS